MTAYGPDGLALVDPPGIDPAVLAAARAEVLARHQATEAAAQAINSARGDLAAVLSLAAAYPYPTPEETGIVDAQAAAALEQFRALTDPPADIVALAAAVVSWRATA